MSVKRLLAGSAMVFSLWVGGVSGASSESLDKFDRLVSHQKENFISTVLHHYYYSYTSNPATAHKANCMVELDQRVVEGGDPYLLTLIKRDLATARADNSGNHTVEGIIRAVIDRECETR